jgi:uncharacterized protein (DUF433 family)
MTSTEVLRTAHSWIQKTPDICGGDACIRNTRVPVWSLVVAQRLGISDAALLHYFVAPLSTADVQAALTYYQQHPDEIEQEIRLNQETEQKTMNRQKRWTAAELRQLPAAERDAIMQAAAALAEEAYRNDPELTAFDAFGKDDLHGDSSSTQTR